MMYASKTPEAIGCTCYWTDPTTWFYYYGAVEPGSQMEPNYECFEHFPHPQHNEPNPILVSFRANDTNPSASEWAASLEHAGLSAWYHADISYIDHARRVLSRLAVLS